MKALLALCLVAAMPALVQAQAAAAPKTAAKHAAKAKSHAKRKLAPSAQKAVEENTPIEDDPSIVISDADREIARKVYVGDIPCELGATVKVVPMKREGMFAITTKGHRFRMHPVESRTGAIRLEDPQGGAMWLQLGNKSMLMSQKLGQRIADECMSPAQLTMAEALKKNPMPSLLEPLPIAVPGPKTGGEDQPPPKPDH
jgi:Ni/Co efflux regulator RcnB